VPVGIAGTTRLLHAPEHCRMLSDELPPDVAMA
jgi:hypothetical protein